MTRQHKASNCIILSTLLRFGYTARTRGNSFRSRPEMKWACKSVIVCASISSAWVVCEVRFYDTSRAALAESKNLKGCYSAWCTGGGTFLLWKKKQRLAKLYELERHVFMSAKFSTCFWTFLFPYFVN